MGSNDGGSMSNSSWNNFRMTLASAKSSEEPAIWGWSAYARPAAMALSELGIDLVGCVSALQNK